MNNLKSDQVYQIIYLKVEKKLQEIWKNVNFLKLKDNQF